MNRNRLKKMLTKSRRIRSIYLIMGFLLCSFNSLAQQHEVIPPTPQSQAMAQFGEYKVDVGSGVPDITIPLLTINHFGYTMNINLKYDCQGLKEGMVHDVYGIGWSLFCGGEISRTVNGSPDEKGGFEKGIVEPTAERYYARSSTRVDMAYDQFSVTMSDGSFFKMYIDKKDDKLIYHTMPHRNVKISYDRLCSALMLVIKIDFDQKKAYCIACSCSQLFALYLSTVGHLYVR